MELFINKLEHSDACDAVLGDKAFTGTYGVKYGRIADNLPPQESVVTLLKAAKIKNIRIYDAGHKLLRAFKGSGIEIVVGLGNEFLKDMSVGEDKAMSWVKENVQQFLPGTKIRGIALGNEILGGTDMELWQVLLPAAKNVYNALSKLDLAKDVQEDVLPYMKPLLQFFSQIGTPFFINAYPFLAYKNDPQHIDLNYALFLKNPGIYDAKTKLHYSNMFEAQVDAAYAALEQVGFDKMDVIVSETGWASHGDGNEAGATIKNARTYNGNLRKRLLKKKGTPYRPKKVVKADGSIAYDIGFTGLVPSSSTSSFLSFKGMRMSQKRRGRGSLDEGQPKPQRFVNYIHASV
ncbi:hypothetical protein JHK82_038309 [Glycine max]|nr:hypothetical protein JHK86_038497 [Glycine max]KAG5115040.1 hypothetical protein JHK82_038309 [Glycine max]KAG5132318.1 hypothetical protein JHK84_038715 [Glycine max]